jgi:lon-related putative ATP-dependent protease
MTETRDPADHPIAPLDASRLRTRCDPGALGFASTEELQPLEALVGQDRALGAIRFGASIKRPGFNLFALGTAGTGRHTAIRALLEEKAKAEPAPDDWVYVNNFDVAHKPKALRLPPGTAVRLRDCMNALVDDLAAAIPALFESDDYRARRRAIDEQAEEAHEKAFDALRQKAEEQSVGILRTPMGFALAPLRDGQVIKPEVFNDLPREERAEIEKKIAGLQEELEAVLMQLPMIQKEHRDRIRELNSEFAGRTVGLSIEQAAREFSGLDSVRDHLAAVEKDLVDNVQIFLEQASASEGQPFTMGGTSRQNDPRFRRYSVNVLVANGEPGTGAPVVFEAHPTLANIVGRVEHISQMGALVTDFMLIKAGALHHANGGYLVIDARRLLTQPFSWEALKRNLSAGCITIASAAEELSLITTISLEPDPIPLQVKVVLVGERLLYYLLASLDPDFPELFKVEADFDEEIERSADTTGLYARLISTIAGREGLRPLTVDGVARVIDEASRRAEDAERLSLQIGPLADLLREADFWAGEDKRDRITQKDVDRAVRQRIRRSDRIRERSLEQITRGNVLIDTDGAVVGQINGLAVTSLGNLSFGRPSRITARVRMGAGKVVDIEREVELGGPLHSKGVLILSSFLSARYALDRPMSLWASLVFEQSYGGVDGDSASSAELYALLSALAELPLRQDLAVTGSVNQIGQVQAIGGVNQKIEGFYDVCAQRGLTGRQGVLIPASNVKHLMLREDVVEAAAQGRFHIYPVETIDQGIELLTGRPAGRRGDDGRFPEGTVNARVEDRLAGYAAVRREYAARLDEHNRDQENKT